MKRYEYKALYARVSIAMSAQEFSDWVFRKLNEWGAEGWHITKYDIPTANNRGQVTLTGEIMATGCRQITGEGSTGNAADETEPGTVAVIQMNEHPMG